MKHDERIVLTIAVLADCLLAVTEDRYLTPPQALAVQSALEAAGGCFIELGEAKGGDDLRVVIRRLMDRGLRGPPS